MNRVAPVRRRRALLRLGSGGGKPFPSAQVPLASSSSPQQPFHDDPASGFGGLLKLVFAFFSFSLFLSTSQAPGCLCGGQAGGEPGALAHLLLSLPRSAADTGQ